jgi:RNA polymerase sigma-70 factor (ECF subfamily)
MSSVEFNDLLLKNADYLKPFAISFTKDAEAAKDLCQETLYKALSNAEKYRFGSNIKAWLFTIMRNIFINDYRRKAKHQIISDSTANDHFLNYKQTTISNIAETNMRVEEIRKAIHHLPEIFKTPFLLYFEGYKYHEIAAAIHEPLGTIKSRIHFARKLLKEQISRY